MRSDPPDEPSLFDLPLNRPPAPSEPRVEPPSEPPVEPLAEPEPMDLFGDAPPEDPEAAGLEATPARPVVAERSEVGSRLRAGLLDASAHGALLLILAIGTWALGVAPSVALLPPLAVMLAVFSFVYHVVPLAFWGQTPGMACFALVAGGPGGAPLTFGQTALRWLGGLATALLLGLPFFLAPGGRSLADRLSRSQTRQARAA